MTQIATCFYDQTTRCQLTLVSSTCTRRRGFLKKWYHWHCIKKYIDSRGFRTKWSCGCQIENLNNYTFAAHWLASFAVDAPTGQEVKVWRFGGLMQIWIKICIPNYHIGIPIRYICCLILARASGITGFWIILLFCPLFTPRHHGRWLWQM